MPSEQAVVAEQLGVSARRLRFIGGRANSHWLVVGEAERYILCGFPPDRSMESVAYQLLVVEKMKRRGWPVPDALAGPITHQGRVWCLLRHLDGQRPSPRSLDGAKQEAQRRGRLLARLHSDLRALPPVQRDDWTEMTDVFGATPSLNSALRRWEQRLPREVALLQRAAETTKSELARLTPHAPPPIIIHGDFTPWNLRFRSGGLSGILDWEFTHLDQRVADFALSWRGRHKDVIRGYEQESPLEEIECELLEPVRRAWLLDDARRTLLRDPDQQAPDLTWTLTHLARQPCQPPTA